MLQHRHGEILMTFLVGLGGVYASATPKDSFTTIGSLLCPVKSTVTCSRCVYVENMGWQIDCSDLNLDEFPDIARPLDSPPFYIHQLFLQNNDIKSILPLKLRDLPIRELYLGNNGLNSTSFLKNSALSSLEILDLTGNEWLEGDRGLLPYQHFSTLTSLKTLKLGSSYITSLNFLRNPTDSSSHLAELETLIISNNDLVFPVAIHPDTFVGKKKLTRLEGVNSGITNVDFLKTSSLENLRVLWLARNQIPFLLRSHVKYLSSLEVLKLNNNNISTLRANVMDRLPSLLRFEWRQNPVTCDCGVSWINGWMKKHPDVMEYDSSLDSCDFFNNPGVGCNAGGTPMLTTTEATVDTFSTVIGEPPGTITIPTETTTERPTESETPAKRRSTTPAPPSGLTQEAIIGIAVGAGAAVLLVLVIIIVVIVRRGCRQSAPKTEVIAGYYADIKDSSASYRSIGSYPDPDYHVYTDPDANLPSSHKRPATIGSERTSAFIENRPLPQKPDDDKDYYNSNKDAQGYLVPSSQLQSKRPTEDVSEVDAYVDFNAPSRDSHYETLGGGGGGSTRDNDEYMTIGSSAVGMAADNPAYVHKSYILK